MEAVSIDTITQSPVPIVIKWEDGTTGNYSLPLLGIRGLLPWLSELTLARRKAALEVIARSQLSPIDKYRAERLVQLDEAIIPDLAVPAQTPVGIERIIGLSVKSSDIPAELQAKAITTILATGFVAANLAQRLSTLFNIEPEEVPEQGTRGPLAGKSGEIQSSSDAASDTTGSQAA